MNEIGTIGKLIKDAEQLIEKLHGVRMSLAGRSKHERRILRVETALKAGPLTAEEIQRKTRLSDRYMAEVLDDERLIETEAGWMMRGE